MCRVYWEAPYIYHGVYNTYNLWAVRHACRYLDQLIRIYDQQEWLRISSKWDRPIGNKNTKKLRRTITIYKHDIQYPVSQIVATKTSNKSVPNEVHTQLVCLSCLLSSSLLYQAARLQVSQQNNSVFNCFSRRCKQSVLHCHYKDIIIWKAFWKPKENRKFLTCFL